jgi:ribonuclease HI
MSGTYNLRIYVDGGVHKASQAHSRGAGAYRFVVFGMLGGTLHDETFTEKDQTVPETEMKALIKALEWANSRPYNKDHYSLNVFCDSELVVKWMSGEYKMRADNIRPLYIKAKEIVAKLEMEGATIKITKIKGKENMAHVEA